MISVVRYGITWVSLGRRTHEENTQCAYNATPFRHRSELLILVTYSCGHQREWGRERQWTRATTGKQEEDADVTW